MVAHLFETAECPPGVAKDIIGHAKTDMTFGIYSGETRMDHRARWLAKAIRYPAVTDARHPVIPYLLGREDICINIPLLLSIFPTSLF